MSISHAVPAEGAFGSAQRWTTWTLQRDYPGLIPKRFMRLQLRAGVFNSVSPSSKLIPDVSPVERQVIAKLLQSILKMQCILIMLMEN